MHPGAQPMSPRALFYGIAFSVPLWAAVVAVVAVAR